MKDKMIPIEEALARLGGKRPTLPLNYVIEALRAYPPDHLLTIFTSRFLKGEEAALLPHVPLLGKQIEIADHDIGERLHDRLLAMPHDLQVLERRHLQLLTPQPGLLRIQPLDRRGRNRHVNVTLGGNARSPYVAKLAFIEDDLTAPLVVDSTVIRTTDNTLGNGEIGRPIRRVADKD